MANQRVYIGEGGLNSERVQLCCPRCGGNYFYSSNNCNYKSMVYSIAVCGNCGKDSMFTLRGTRIATLKDDRDTFLLSRRSMSEWELRIECIGVGE